MGQPKKTIEHRQYIKENGRAIKLALKKAGLSQAAMAQKLGISSQLFHQWMHYCGINPSYAIKVLHAYKELYHQKYQCDPSFAEQMPFNPTMTLPDIFLDTHYQHDNNVDK